jgi:hypothetical protein
VITQYEKGKFYQYTGSEFVEPGTKISVTNEAMAAVTATRKAAQAHIGMRPELSLVASAMILEAAKLSTIAESVAAYGRRLYNSVANVKTENDSQPESPAAPAAPQGEPESQFASS